MAAKPRDLAATGAIALAAALLFATPLAPLLEGLSIDALFWLRQRAFGPLHPAADSPAVVLAIDEETYRRPPFADLPQALWTPELGRALNAVLDAGAKVIGFDVVYPTSVEPLLRGFERDYLLALRRGGREGRIVLGRVQHQERPIAPFAGHAIAVGRDANIRALNVFEDDDGIIRRLPLTFRVGAAATAAARENALAVELAARAQGLPAGTLPTEGPDGRYTLGAYRLPRDRGETLVVNHGGGAGDIPTYSLADIHACAAAGRTDYLETHFKGRVVLLGTVLDVEDRKLTSKRWITTPEGEGLSARCVHPVMSGLYRAGFRRDAIPGVYIHAAGINNLLRGDGLAPLGAGPSFALSLGFALVVAAAAMTLAPPMAGGAVALTALAWIAVATLAFRHGTVLPLFQALASGLAAFPALMAWRFLVTDSDRRRLGQAFGLYLPRAEIDRMMAQGRPPELGGEARAVSILFSDIAGFTAISEKRDPARLIEDLNQYFAAMTEIVEAQGGFVDKFIGDAVVAVFGAPVADPDHARRAVLAAIEMRRVLADEAARFTLGDGQPVRARIGVNSGMALVGNIGSPRRFNYTVMGDAVNLAARLEGANKGYGTQILVSADTADACGAAIVFREIDRVRVVGRTAPVGLLEPLAPAEAATAADRARAESFAAALALWRTGDFAQARAGFAALAPADGAAAKFATRAEAMAKAPPRDWDGVTDLREK
ncbi:MAG: adenylate/guanylate cyclase domain-containing protein [Alphaproteobacteria bacterium]|nr:adenylate/guanylate cyclase domain-containing protein [Alphaproteobacteria bacterium]